MNAAEEFLNIISQGNKKITCASIEVDWDLRDWGLGWLNRVPDEKEGDPQINLKLGYSDEDLKSFLKNLDFEYDSGFGNQVISGFIWCDDGTWFERKEYDGSEKWELKEMPAIPSFLIPEFFEVKKGD